MKPENLSWNTYFFAVEILINKLCRMLKYVTTHNYCSLITIFYFIV